MHPYSTHESRVYVYATLAVAAVVVSWGLSVVTAGLSWWPQWLISAPSLAGTYAGLYQLFDKHAWRWSLFAKLGFVKIRDISGTYEGKLVSTYKDPADKPIERELRLEIAQTWTRISIEMTVTSEASTSLSTSALGSLTHDGAATCLLYMYRNKVNPAVADADMGDHDGAADLRIYEDGRVAGRYFNSRPRAGTIEARKKIREA